MPPHQHHRAAAARSWSRPRQSTRGVANARGPLHGRANVGRAACVFAARGGTRHSSAALNWRWTQNMVSRWHRPAIEDEAYLNTVLAVSKRLLLETRGRAPLCWLIGWDPLPPKEMRWG
jgi:hypothetical protein